jgi:hypothetical protein
VTPRDRLPSLDQIASATASRVSDGPATGCRALDLRVRDGIDLRLLPDRGLDVGAAWYRGTPLAWISAVGERPPLPAPRGDDWLLAFGGGLVTTCGLRNVGAPSEGHGLHGAYSHQRASDVRVEREADGDVVVLTVSGRIVEASALGWHLEVERTIRTRTGTGLVELEDVTRNLGRDPEPAPILYHVNVGAPVWDAGARIEVDARETIPRDDDAAAALDAWDTAPGTVPGARERVFEHVVEPGPGGWARARVHGACGVDLELSWHADGLPRLHQWVHPAPGIAVLGLEPANCSVLGRAVDRAAGRLPVLAPGEARVTRLAIAASAAR